MERMSRVRSLLLLAGIPLLTWQIGLLVRPFFVSPVTRETDVLARVLGAVLFAAWARIALAITVAAGEAFVMARLRHGRPGTSRAVRTFVACCCGLGVAVASSAAQAAELDGLPLPDRVVGRASAAPPAAVAPTSDSDDPATDAATAAAPAYVVVRQGDCLWTLADRHETTWRTLYDLNRQTIGSDPDLILPGQRLALPQAVER